MSTPKERVPIPKNVAAEVLFAFDRVCCMCQEPGREVQIHHIDDDPTNNSIENFAVLCFICHNETQVRGGFGRRLDAEQVRRYRSDWLERVRMRRAEADRLAVQAKTLGSKGLNSKPKSAAMVLPSLPSSTGLIEYVQTLPDLRHLAYQSARPGWSSGTTDMMNSSYRVIDALEAALGILATYYPFGHFDPDNSRNYFSELIASRFRWHRLLHSTSGLGFSGTIVGPLATGGVIADVEEMIRDMVASLTIDLRNSTGFDFKVWEAKWREASKE